MANVFPYWTKLMFVKPILVMTNSKSNTIDIRTRKGFWTNFLFWYVNIGNSVLVF